MRISRQPSQNLRRPRRMPWQPGLTASSCTARTAICLNSSSVRTRISVPMVMVVRSRNVPVSCWSWPKQRLLRLAGTKWASGFRHSACSTTCPCTTVWRLSLIHISEPTRLRRISYAVLCLKKKKKKEEEERRKGEKKKKEKGREEEGREK